VSEPGSAKLTRTSSRSKEVQMSPDVHHLPPRCRACQRPMELIHVLSDSKYVDAPVRTYRCSTCGTGLIRKSLPSSSISRLTSPPDQIASPGWRFRSGNSNHNPGGTGEATRRGIVNRLACWKRE
jgi:hypothetical protein